MRKRITILIVLIIAGILGYNYIYQDHRDIAHEIAQFKLTAEAIGASFLENSSQAETKYLNTTIEVSGHITEMDDKTITLDDRVFCQFADATQGIDKTSKIIIKGRVIGYDDLLEQVKLDQCTVQ